MPASLEECWQSVGGIATVQGNGCLFPSPGRFAPPSTYVYRIKHADGELQRLVSRSDILYIGKGTRGRVLGLWTGHHSAVLRLSRAAWAKSSNDDRPLRVQVECRPTSQPDLYEMGLLNAFVAKHGEIPPLNGRFEGWLAPRALSALADHAIGRSKGGCRSRAYSWPREDPASTVVDLFSGSTLQNRGDWLCSLAWIWPEGWTEARPDLVDRGGELLLCVPGAEGPPVPASLCVRGYFDLCGVPASCKAQELTGQGLSENGKGSVLEELLAGPMPGRSPVERLQRRIHSISEGGR